MVLSQQQKLRLASNIDATLQKYTVSDDAESQPRVNGLVQGVSDDKGTVYLKGSGYKDIGTGAKLDVDDIFGVYSCTKTITAMGALRLVDEGRLDLDAPVTKYLPEVAEIGVIDYDAVNEETGAYEKFPTAPNSPVTVRQLLLHTSGFAYPFTHYDVLVLATKNKPKEFNPNDPTRAYFTNEKTPLVHEPGSRWIYGYSFDFLGFVIEAVSGKKLGEYLKEAIFDPAGMTSTTFHLTGDKSNVVKLHLRRSTGKLTSLPKGIAHDPILDLGGQGVFTNVSDYLKFLRVWLNYGISPDTGKRILKEETVLNAIKDHLPAEIEMDAFPGLSTFDLEGEDLAREGFTLTGNARVSNRLPTGRPVGSIYWSGFANLYYWIDFENKIAGFQAGQIMPSRDPESVAAFNEFETAVYKSLKGDSKL